MEYVNIVKLKVIAKHRINICMFYQFLLNATMQQFNKFFL